jgi:hypothetical protein
MIHQGADREKGQSTVEFALTLLLLMGVVLFFMQLSLVFGVGNYIHYATFMSARAYLSAGPTPDDQVKRAKDVIIGTLKAGQTLENRDRFPGVARAEAGDSGLTGLDIGDSHFQQGQRDLSWLQGVRYTFRSRLFLLPLGANPSQGQNGQNGQGPSGSKGNTLKLSSESWLGREPAENDCLSVLQPLEGIYDNGC